MPRHSLVDLLSMEEPTVLSQARLHVAGQVVALHVLTLRFGVARLCSLFGISSPRMIREMSMSAVAYPLGTLA